MKNFITFALLLLIAYVYAEDKYTNKYDNIDLDEILNNRRLLRNYVNCLLDKGNCTPDGNELKKVLPDALKTKCSKCSPRQEDGTKKVLRHLIKKELDWFNELEKKYDPEGIYKKLYEEESKQESVSTK